MSPSLLTEIHRIVSLLPSEVLGSLTQQLAQANAPCSEALVSQLLQSVTNPRFRRLLQDLLVTWRDDPTLLWSSTELAAALTSSAYTVQATRQELAVELVWTGPSCSNLAIRRTDQVLLQLIRECQQEITLISFAIYKIPEIVEELILALDRGIKLRIVAETPDSGEGKIAFGLQSTFTDSILKQAEVLIWPRDKRPVDGAGKYGSLHIKGAIADQEKLFVTSTAWRKCIYP
ncbi:DISARM system phospholipase D-like protein DrmC [Halomicronema sp. CCY15110]|uniref:DISARM system phospholipase D-like protein DrmC n=1 Tax=Halomicronema sp. CCY15110 TaxID=2767773 RepID=UPI0019523EF0|nr:DISARM system phospholipase D-like protein DrmC [Halomicronema sp. CCY15110]